MSFSAGMTAEEFVSRPKLSSSSKGSGSRYGLSQYQLLQQMIASWLDVAVSNVDIFTVLNHPTDERTIDVRYAAHGSPYYRATKLNGIMAQYKTQVCFMYNAISEKIFKFNFQVCYFERLTNPQTNFCWVKISVYYCLLFCFDYLLLNF